jgi:hypothetical protein
MTPGLREMLLVFSEPQQSLRRSPFPDRALRVQKLVFKPCEPSDHRSAITGVSASEAFDLGGVFNSFGYLYRTRDDPQAGLWISGRSITATYRANGCRQCPAQLSRREYPGKRFLLYAIVASSKILHRLFHPCSYLVHAIVLDLKVDRLELLPNLIVDFPLVDENDDAIRRQGEVSVCYGAIGYISRTSDVEQPGDSGEGGEYVDPILMRGPLGHCLPDQRKFGRCCVSSKLQRVRHERVERSGWSWPDLVDQVGRERDYFRIRPIEVRLDRLNGDWLSDHGQAMVGFRDVKHTQRDEFRIDAHSASFFDLL